MKVPASVRRLYEDQFTRNQRLKEEVDKRVIGFKDHRWHYESRVKELQSFALKVESGRFASPEALEDFFACTIVVANFSEIRRAEELVRQSFFFVSRRPEQNDKTHKASSDFPFDDLRLYLKLLEDPALPPSDLTSVTFELQIKTFLQHAWAIATHDLVYKTDDASWSKERIAYQTKAMLEHAEVSIQEAERLASSGSLAMQNRQSSQIRDGIALLKRHWNADELPTDVRLLAQNLVALIDAIKIDLSRLEQVLNQGKAALAGTHPANLSPFGTIVQYLLVDEKQSMTRLLEDDRKWRPRVLVPAEVDVPADVDRARWRNVIILN